MSKERPRKSKNVSPQAGLSHDKTARSTYFKKSIFRYSAQIGHLPREVESFLFIQRKNRKTKVTRVIPEVVYPIQANRPAVPKHELLEDDWRAYRSVIHNYQTILQSQMDPSLRMLEYFKCSHLARKIYNLRGRIDDAIFSPTLAMYKDSVDAPLGYSYRRYKQSSVVKQDEAGLKSGRQQLKIPVLVFEGPLMDVVHIQQGKRVKSEWDRETKYYDADVIVTKPSRRTLYIYNEPDAIPLSCSRNDFSQPLSERAKKAATSINCVIPEEDAQTQAPLLSNIIHNHPNIPIPELM